MSSPHVHAELTVLPFMRCTSRRARRQAHRVGRELVVVAARDRGDQDAKSTARRNRKSRPPRRPVTVDVDDRVQRQVPRCSGRPWGPGRSEQLWRPVATFSPTVKTPSPAKRSTSGIEARRRRSGGEYGERASYGDLASLSQAHQPLASQCSSTSIDVRAWTARTASASRAVTLARTVTELYIDVNVTARRVTGRRSGFDLSTSSAYVEGIEAWLADPPALRAATTVTPEFPGVEDDVGAALGPGFRRGLGRYGWPTAVGRLGGSILHQAAMWDALARHGVRGMALFEHLEILAPTLLAWASGVVSRLLPRFLAGEERWAQGSPGPDAGSDLAGIGRGRPRPTAAT